MTTKLTPPLEERNARALAGLTVTTCDGQRHTLGEEFRRVYNMICYLTTGGRQVYVPMIPETYAVKTALEPYPFQIVEKIG